MTKKYSVTIKMDPLMRNLLMGVTILCIFLSIVWFGFLIFSPKTQAEGLGFLLSESAREGLWLGISTLGMGIIGLLFLRRAKASS